MVGRGIMSAMTFLLFLITVITLLHLPGMTWAQQNSQQTTSTAPSTNDDPPFTATAAANSSRSIIIKITIPKDSQYAASAKFDIRFWVRNCHALSCPCNGYICHFAGGSDYTTVGHGVRSIKIDHLRKYTSYSLTVQHRFKPSKRFELDVTTLPDNPSQLRDLRAAVQQVHSEPAIVVSWKEPAEPNDADLSYSLDIVYSSTRYLVQNVQSPFLLNFAPPGKSLSLFLRATNSHGNSPYSVFNISVPRELPLPGTTLPATTATAAAA
eukprot:scpid86282/ scgid5205/ 